MVARRTPVVLSAAFAALVTMDMNGQAPGDRPAPNPRATRSVVMARNGLVATSQPLASAAGLRALMNGGNAVDAAVTAAAVLSVVEPTMNGLGGDLFALVYDPADRSLHALNASGRAPAAATPEAMRARGLTAIPGRGMLSVTVPGMVDGWAELLARHGTLGFDRVLQPAISHARDGFAVSEIIAHQWARVEGVLAGDPETAALYLPGGRAPRPGDLFRNPALARSLDQLARQGRDAFYRGPLAEAIAAGVARHGGLLAAADLAAHRSDWVEPLSTTYRGYEVFELPPNTQGFVALEMLNILEGYDIRALGHNSADYLHLLVEAKRAAFADRAAWLADADHVPSAVLARLVSKAHAAERRKEISLDRTAPSPAPFRDGAQDEAGAGGGSGDTIYLTVADGRGMVVSLIQSIYENFGSGLVAGDTGIVLHNRGSLFTLAEGHPNRLAPGKRPLHTLIPAMAFKDGRPWLSFGVMGGEMQPQGHVQVLVNLVDFGMNVQEAGEAARVRHMGDVLAVETGIAPGVRAELARRGHRLVEGEDIYGGFQGILIDPRTGVFHGGSDPRKDGLAIGY